MSVIPGLEAKLVVAVLPLVDAYGREKLGIAMAAMARDMLAGTPGGAEAEDLRMATLELSMALGNPCLEVTGCQTMESQLARYAAAWVRERQPARDEPFAPYDCERCGVHISGGTSGGPVCLKCRVAERGIAKALKGGASGKA